MLTNLRSTFQHLVQRFCFDVLGFTRTLKLIRWAAKGNEDLLEKEDLEWIKEEPLPLSPGMRAYHLHAFNDKLEIVEVTSKEPD